MIGGMDPGLRKCGFCVLRADGSIHSAFLAKNLIKPPMRGPEAWAGMADAVYVALLLHLPPEEHQIDLLALEGPKVYQGNRAKGDPADLIELAGVLGEVHSLLRPKAVRYYARPADWKGTIDGNVMIERIKRLTLPDERARIDLPNAKGDHEHVWDAIGIAFHSIGRLAPTRAYRYE